MLSSVVLNSRAGMKCTIVSNEKKKTREKLLLPSVVVISGAGIKHTLVINVKRS